MQQIAEQKNCTGCGACRLVCHAGCIKMGYDNEGFMIPHVDEACCTDCGLCTLRCPQNSRLTYASNNCLMVLGAKNKDDALLLNSASGGVFAGVAAKILETPGNAVFGCAFDENIVARHTCVTDIRGIAPLQSSKYVQSDVGDTYLQAGTMLEEGKTVFYSGCPCQIAGLYAFLGKEYSNLLTADLICLGVPSPLLFKRYIDRLGRQFGEDVIYYNFRSKEKCGGGSKSVVKIKTKTRTKTIMPLVDPYYDSFLQSRSLRESCYTCKYANAARVGDITLGDFWGVEAVCPQFYDSRGVSVVLVNTKKGELFFKKAYGDFEIVTSTFEKIAAFQTYLREPSHRPAERDSAYKGIENEAIDVFNNPCYKISPKTYIKASIKRILPHFAIRLYKKWKGIGKT